MVNADTHPSVIGGDVINTIRHRPAEFRDREVVVHPHSFRIPLWPQLAPAIPEVANELFLLGVH